MRILNAVLAVLLLLFAAVQYNDTDGLFWGGVYGFGAAWCGLAALRLRVLAHRAVRAAYALSLAAAVVGLASYWPRTPQWWAREVWWETETAREGMGMMVLVIALLAAGVLVWRQRPGQR